MAKDITISLPALVIAIAVIILILLFWIFSRNVQAVDDVLMKKLSLEHSVSALADVVSSTARFSGGAPDTTSQQPVTRPTHPQLYDLLNSIERLKLVDDPKAYVFVIDTAGNQVVNGGNPAIAHRGEARPGSNTLEYTDPDNTKAVQALLAKAASGGGFVEYKWPDPHTKQLHKKLAFVKAVPNSKWVIGSGLYVTK
jgi:signal transduction histidine kinase